MLSVGMIEQQEYQGSDDFQQLVDDQLVDMCEAGVLLSICPKCHIPLAHEELKALICGSCGSILDFENILFQTTDSIPKG
jgi:hypothetical protein